ncbi:MAG: hypothetical protein QGH60_17935, partial [Phycisphaerae bacterium]|nr:hypothetical protein [Phycisphaerae bacterium]
HRSSWFSFRKTWQLATGNWQLATTTATSNDTGKTRTTRQSKPSATRRQVFAVASCQLPVASCHAVTTPLLLPPYTYILAKEARSVTPPQKDFLSSENVNRITLERSGCSESFARGKNFPFRPTKFLKIFAHTTNAKTCQSQITQNRLRCRASSPVVVVNRL